MESGIDDDAIPGVAVIIDPPSSDEAEGGRGNDSDPPIENDNPDGDKNPANAQKNEFLQLVKRQAQLHQRKRKRSTHAQDGNYVPPYKKNGHGRFRHLQSVLPSKFLLGGNIRDPLNLASLSDAKISAELNKTTPVCSPLPVRPGEVPVFIPKNPHDPLGLTTKTPENVGDIVAGVRKNSLSRKHRHRKHRKRTDSECSLGNECPGGQDTDEQEEEETGKGKKEEINNSTNTSAGVLPSIDSRAPSTSTVVSKEVKEEEEEEEEKGKKETSSKKSKPKKEEPKRSAATSSAPPPASSAPNKSEEYQYQDYDDGVQRSSSEYSYTPLGGGSSSNYSPSPFAFDSTDYWLEGPPPYESPFSHFATPTHHLQPFSPPPLPEIPPFQRRAALFAARPQHLSLQRAVFHRPAAAFKKRGKNRSDPIVSPVIPQPGSSKGNNNRRRSFHKKPDGKANTSNESIITAPEASSSTAKYRDKDKVFQFGNYSHYYGYRAADQGDPRLWALKKEYFGSKEVLDIGCNAGHVTLSIARDFEPRRIHGIDIDYSLITVARKNIKNFLIQDPENKGVVFPRSLPLIYGSMQPPPAPGEKTANVFPYNVSFAHENYVLNNDAQLESVIPQYDVIVCFSVTKWIHLNYGDSGIKRFFKRIYRHLHPGGLLILEPQPWYSYTKKKKLTEKIHQNFQSIKFYPEQFEEYLLSREIGFGSVESLGTPAHNSKGFQRPILLFTKSLETSAQDANVELPVTSKNSQETETPSNTNVSQSLGIEKIAVSSSSDRR